MKILEYFKSLVASFKRNTLMEDSRIVSTELKTKAIPVYTEAARKFRGSGKFESNECRDFEKRYFSFSGKDNSKGMIESILGKLKLMQKILEITSGIVEHKFEDTTLVNGLTVLKVNVIKVLDSAGFISRYSLHLLNAVYIYETAFLTGDKNYVEDHLSKGQIKWLNDNFMSFAKLIDAIGIDEADFEKVMTDIPDVSFSADPEAVTGALGEQTVNPLGLLSFSPTSNNPIYHIRLMIAEYQANRYKESTELKTVLELRLLNLEKANAKNPDVKLEQEIAYTQSRIDRITTAIRDAEESVE